MRLEFSFSNIVLMFLLHYTCNIHRSISSRKALEFLSKVWKSMLLSIFCTQNNVFEVIRSFGGWELSLSACPGEGNKPPSKKKIVNPREYARGVDGNR